VPCTVNTPTYNGGEIVSNVSHRTDTFCIDYIGEQQKLYVSGCGALDKYNILTLLRFVEFCLSNLFPAMTTMAGVQRDVDLEKAAAGIANYPKIPPLGIDIDVQPGMLLPEMSYEQRLFHYTYSTADEKLLFMGFRLLQRLNLVHLQNELAQLKSAVWKDMSADRKDLKKLRVTMHEYGKQSSFVFSLQNMDISCL
jgi:hypothetical protein